MPKLEVEDRSRAPQQPPCTTTNLLTDSAVELIASAVRSVVSNRGTEPVVLDHIGALAACISTKWSSAVPEGASFGVTVFIERLSKLFSKSYLLSFLPYRSYLIVLLPTLLLHIITFVRYL